MGEIIELTATDGKTIHGYRASPAGTPKGGIVVLQEIFGVNGHIRRVCDGYAAQGYLVVAPALFDRVEPGIELGYQQADVQRGLDIRGAVDLDHALADIAAAVTLASAAGKVGLVGYCWGGLLAWVAAARLSGIGAAIGYYGGRIAQHLGEMPNVPVMLHFGEQDHAIPLSEVEEIRRQHPDLPIYTYPAGHGFNCDERASYDRAAAALAFDRSLRFFAEKLG